jgi:hypothetical protein
VLHPVFLPYTDSELLEHFMSSDAAEAKPPQHLASWKKRIDDAPGRDPAFIHRDETLWTAGALLAVHRTPDRAAAWRALAERTFGGDPPPSAARSWDDLLGDDLELYFEVGLASPRTYREWLRDELPNRHPLIPQVRRGAGQGVALEGHTQLDALLLSRSTGFAWHFEAKVLSDIACKTTFDGLRNQLARNLDCMVHPSPQEGPLKARDPTRSFLALLTPRLFRENWESRLYGHLLRQYQADAKALKRDLPHLDMAVCEGLRARIGWLTFEDIQSVAPAACPWLHGDSFDGAGT